MARPGDASRGVYTPDAARAVPSGSGSGAPSTEKIPDPFITPFKDEEKKSRKWKKVLFFLLGILILCGVGGGLAGGLITKKKADDAQAAANPAAGDAGNDSGLYDKNSAAVKKLMNNKNLHKVFTGMAYTPMNTQYPDCLNLKPLQNNVTLDLAVLSQLTNVVRLYGTDCGQTELVLTAIDKLGLTDMKVWLGIWLDNNQTTVDRQISQFWNIIDKYPSTNIKGVVVGNEVLFRKDLTITALTKYISDVKTNLTSKSINIPVATSDLGDNWTAELATAVDTVMSNVHPFFAGVNVEQAAGWTWDFWTSHDVILTKGTSKGNVISEVGWPSAGGNDCGGPACTSSTAGSVAGISQMNTFMSTFVCQSLTNKTDYFWFEGYDEPWKVQFDTPGQAWEDKWGLFDVNRNLKSGLTIPSCNGQTVTSS
ncbi:glycoside hydrolase [Microthyrium microscopicum]|uniref:glucan endo-1,3-beta-D-glucosidase n=1 Tax=Microthyrium microscopicum TaxID=703497 RepID=A0A6A6US01_9PEZI|nr:glycoside hydrolase [Microthyrium microscopicum]